MVGRAEPLVIDIFMATLAGIGLHEEFAGDFLPSVHLGRTGEECSLGAIAFAIHAGGGHRGILNPRMHLPTGFAYITGAVSQYHHQQDRGCTTRNRGPRQPAASPGPIGKQQSRAAQREHDVGIDPIPLKTGRTELDQSDSKHGSPCQQQPSRACNPSAFTYQSNETDRQENGR